MSDDKDDEKPPFSEGDGEEWKRGGDGDGPPDDGSKPEGDSEDGDSESGEDIPAGFLNPILLLGRIGLLLEQNENLQKILIAQKSIYDQVGIAYQRLVDLQNGIIKDSNTELANNLSESIILRQMLEEKSRTIVALEAEIAELAIRRYMVSAILIFAGFALGIIITTAFLLP